jgi:hypothetical protein
MTLICKTQTFGPNGIPWCGSKEKGYIFLSTLIRACCIFGDFATGYVCHSIHFQHLLKLCFFFWWCLFSSLWFLIHAWFLGISIKICQCVNKQILVLKGDKKNLNLCWSHWLNITLEIFMIPPNFVQKLQMTMILIMMTCLTSHFMVVKIYFVNKCLWVCVFEISHISNSWLIHTIVVSKSHCNPHFHVTKNDQILHSKLASTSKSLGCPSNIVVLWVFNIVSPCTWRYVLFFAQDDFLQSPSQSPNLLIYVVQLANLCVAQ